MLHSIFNVNGVKRLTKNEQKSIFGSIASIPCLTCRRQTDCCDAAAECVRGGCRIWV